MEMLKELLKKYKNILFILLFFVIAALIFFSGGEKKVEKEKEEPSIDTTQYLEESERRLTGVLEQMSGVGKVQVYLTLESGEEKIYATESRTNQQSRSSMTDGSGDKSLENNAEGEETYLVLRGSGGEETPILLKTLEPKIRGAVILCEGGEDPAIREKVLKAASAALNISSSKIYVTK